MVLGSVQDGVTDQLPAEALALNAISFVCANERFADLNEAADAADATRWR
jgi:hypothetical protein